MKHPEGAMWYVEETDDHHAGWYKFDGRAWSFFKDCTTYEHVWRPCETKPRRILIPVELL